jgi:hypothetical protein
MPQFDFSSAFVQVFWFLIFAFFFYCYFLKYYLFNICFVLKLRFRFVQKLKQFPKEKCEKVFL